MIQAKTDESVVERRRPLLKKDSRPISMASEEPLLDPQLAAMLEARKIKAGENPSKSTQLSNGISL